MGVYWLTCKDLYSHNIGISYHTYHRINFLWLVTSHRISLHCMYHDITLPQFAAFHGTSFLWLAIILVRIYFTSLNTYYQHLLIVFDFTMFHPDLNREVIINLNYQRIQFSFFNWISNQTFKKTLCFTEKV